MIKYNKLLNNECRKEAEPLIKDMFAKCPAMMSRKIKEANVQQAFVIKTVLDFLNTPILCVGSYEDTAYEYLKTLGIEITAIDPIINVDLHTFRETNKQKWQVIFSTSVIEHVKDDELFVRDICESLEVGGVAILTCDFKGDWKEGQPVHPSDFRFYTENDLGVRLDKIIKEYGCKLIDTPNWKGKPDFFFDGFQYGFATWVFRKEALDSFDSSEYNF